MKRKHFGVLAAASVFCCAAANAVVTVTIEESGGDVVASFSGSLDTAALSCTALGTGAILDFTSPTDYAYLLGDAPGVLAVDGCPVTFGTAEPFGGAGVTPDAGTGAIGVEVSGGNAIYVPSGYTSGAAISGSSTFTGQTIAGLSLTPGTFVFDYGADSITFVVVDPAAGGGALPTAVPATPLWTLLLTAGLFLGIVRRRLVS
ncbi:MAG: hypothetical protein OEV88_14230 [Gammaproteobacteria bacterium]|nr:hypothetical protein [Gammaproteobacteria bacterium]